jgi:hypothetical protein
MASPTPSATANSGGGGKVLGLKPRTAIIAGVGILAAAIGYMLWKRHQSASSSATAASASASSSTSGIDYGGELSVIQSELEDLLAAEGQSSSSTGSSSTGTTTGTGTSSTGTGTGTGSTSSTSTTTATKTAAPAMPAAHETKVTASSVTLAWAKVANATSYRVRVTYQGKLVGTPHVVTGTSATISGLGADHTYTFHVAAIGPGGTSSETNGPAVKTSK